MAGAKRPPPVGFLEVYGVHMPLTPLPPSNTARLFVDYISVGDRHTVVFRPQTGVSQVAFVAYIHDLLVQNVALFFTTTIFDGARWADAGSDVTNPQLWESISGTGAGTPAEWQSTAFVSFVGRSSDGRRTKHSFFGHIEAAQNDYRIVQGETPRIDAFVADLSNVNGLIGTISGLKPIYKTYANFGYNAYWQRALRP